MSECKCLMFQQLGKCWHTGYNPVTEHKQTPTNGVPKKPKASRTIPNAFHRRADFLDYLEELKPGSSGITGEW